MSTEDDHWNADPLTAKLYATTDAMTWATEWCRIAREIEAAADERQVIDEGWLVSWFANYAQVSLAPYEALRDAVRVWRNDLIPKTSTGGKPAVDQLLAAIAKFD